MAKPEEKNTNKPISSKQYLAELGFVFELIDSDPSLQTWITRVREYMKNNDNRVPTPYEMDGLKKDIDWFNKYNSYQQQARIDQADPRRKADFDRALELKKQSVSAITDQYGVQLDDAFLSGLALQARLDNLTKEEIQQRLAPILEKTILEGGDLGGTAAEFERGIVQWADRNGLSLSGNAVAKYVTAGVEGKSTLDDIKNDLRRTYLSGSYPAWSDRIMQGEDPADIAAPYKTKIASLLEVDEDQVDLNDTLLQRAMQGVGSDGKPRVVPLYEFEKQVREDPRWQYTDNARKTYSTMADDVLKMFGFR